MSLKIAILYDIKLSESPFFSHYMDYSDEYLSDELRKKNRVLEVLSKNGSRCITRDYKFYQKVDPETSDVELDEEIKRLNNYFNTQGRNYDKFVEISLPVFKSNKNKPKKNTVYARKSTQRKEVPKVDSTLSEESFSDPGSPVISSTPNKKKKESLFTQRANEISKSHSDLEAGSLQTIQSRVDGPRHNIESRVDNLRPQTSNEDLYNLINSKFQIFSDQISDMQSDIKKK